MVSTPLRHCGKAATIDTFHGERQDEHWDDWLQTFERAAEWNEWTNSERLLQLAGYLKGKAKQEYSLLEPSVKSDFTAVVAAMRCRLDAGSHTIAAQDFRHATTQGSSEPVAYYILRLEKTFRRAYGNDHMSEETHKILLHGQLQECIFASAV